jgi:copper chaperone CopZ
MKKKFIKIAIWSGSIFALLVTVLAVHIYMVIPPKEQNPTVNWQLSRIDIKESLPLSEEQVNEINRSIKSIDGVERAVVNKDHGTIVVAYFPSKNNIDEIYSRFTENTVISTSLFKPTKDQLAASCPVIDKNSISYRMGSFFQNIFQN